MFGSNSYVILFHSRWWIDLIDQILLFQILIRFSIIRMTKADIVTSGSRRNPFNHQRPGLLKLLFVIPVKSTILINFESLPSRMTVKVEFLLYKKSWSRVWFGSKQMDEPRFAEASVRCTKESSRLIRTFLPSSSSCSLYFVSWAIYTEAYYWVRWRKTMVVFHREILCWMIKRVCLSRKGLGYLHLHVIGRIKGPLSIYTIWWAN